jgi:alpha-1,2-mannosyltransferase
MVTSIGRVVAALAECSWLGDERARAYARILLAVTVMGAAGWIVLSSGGLDREGKPIGTDFVGFYAASRLALAGRPELAYDVAAHWAAQKALFGPKLGYTAFFYPPPALLLSLPLAFAPYFWSLAAWLAATGYAFYRVLRAYLPSLDLIAFLAFPAVFVNAAHGQNGFLTAALIGGGLLVMNARPVLAGVLFGAMAFKPHLALILPFALVFARRWTTLIVAAATAAALSAASLGAFGLSTWAGFLADAPLARSALENNLVGDEKMQSVFAAVRLLHGSRAFAWAAQIATALCVIGVLWRLERRSFRGPGEAAAIVCAGLLASPFLLDYDLTLIAIPLAWLVGEGRRNGFLPFEKSIMALAFALPLISRAVAGTIGLPLAPMTIASILVLTVRRALKGVRGARSCVSHPRQMQRCISLQRSNSDSDDCEHAPILQAGR